MRKLLFITIIFSAVLAGCNSKTDEFIDSAKDAFINDDYELAYDHLEQALNEDPTNEEAQSLLKKAENELNKIEESEKIKVEHQERLFILKDYAEQISKIYFDYFDQADKIPLENENYEEHLNLASESLASIPSSPPKDLFEVHQKFKEFYRLRKKSMNTLISSDNLSEALEYIDKSNDLLEGYFYEVTKYLNENDIDPKDVGWVFY